MRVISDAEVASRLTMKRCIEVVADALRALGRGEAVQPLRSALVPPGFPGLLGLMPGALLGPGILGAKILSVFPGNHHEGKPSHQGAILLFDARDGHPIALCEAGKLTAMRTAAASAVATDLLAPLNAGRAAILGAGVQGEHHLWAMAEVRTLTHAAVWDLDPGRAARFAAAASARHPFPVEAVPSAQAALEGADLICTVTPAREPIVASAWVAPGAHLNAVGACTPSARELDSDLVARARLFTDSRESLFHEAGDFLIPRQEGRVADDHVLGDLGELLLGRVQGRRTPGEVTLFKALGLAVEDLAAAWEVCGYFL